MRRSNAHELSASSDPLVEQFDTIAARVRIPWLGSFLGRNTHPSIVTANSLCRQTLNLLAGNVLTPWAIIWRPLTGASEALIPDIPFAEFPDSLELAQPCLQRFV